MAKENTPLDKLIIESGLRMKVVANQFGLSRSGFYKKRQTPKNLTADEMLKIAKIINVDETVVFDAVLKTNVS
ncbi:helix-turn-helix domain-containing protein [Lactococcus taiwanensis]|uniref:helix-turn-helix domain-containing protein n=1 Tax=Lactococcus taiwanensis TaxID=1151742 RepID=UPI0035126402